MQSVLKLAYQASELKTMSGGNTPLSATRLWDQFDISLFKTMRV